LQHFLFESEIMNQRKGASRTERELDQFLSEEGELLKQQTRAMTPSPP
jgi:hypothetical protein